MNLLPFQETGVKYLRAGVKRLLVDDPGLGKTAEAVMALPDRAAGLVVCPGALSSVWRDELAKWRPDLAVTVVRERGQFVWPRHGEVVIVSWGMLPEEAPRPPAGCSLIADEVHLAKNKSADRTKRFKALRTQILKAGGTAWGLTGTPLYNDPPDLWGVLDSLGMAEDVFGRYGTLIYMFRGYETRFGMRWGTPRPEVKDLLAKCVLGRRREDVLPELPRKLYQEINVDIDRHSIPMFAVDSRGHSATISRARAALAQAKVRAAMPALKEMASREPLVVFSYHRGAAEEAAASLGVEAVVGGEGAAGDVVARFQRGDSPHIVGTTGAMGVGFTLVRAHTVVFIDRDWTPAMNEQAEDRICRIGQEAKGVRIVDITCDHPLDVRVRKVIAEKEKIVDASLGALKEEASKDGV